MASRLTGGRGRRLWICGALTAWAKRLPQN